MSRGRNHHWEDAYGSSRLRADSCCSTRVWEAPREAWRDGQEDQQAEQRGQLVDCRTDGRPQLALGRTEDAEQGSGRIHGGAGDGQAGATAASSRAAAPLPRRHLADGRAAHARTGRGRRRWPRGEEPRRRRPAEEAEAARSATGRACCSPPVTGSTTDPQRGRRGRAQTALAGAARRRGWIRRNGRRTEDGGDGSMTGRGCCFPPASGSTTGRTAMEIYDEILLLLLLLRRSY